jgi:hypothetical protein
MKIEQKYVFIWAFISLILFICIFIWIQKYAGDFIIECFGNYKYIDTGSPNTNHTVNLPINDTLDCSNMCGPLGVCYKTGEQCTSDIDCPGCNPHNPDEEYIIPHNKELPGQNAAGKLSYYTPQYSELTTDIGTKSKLIGKKISAPPQYYPGVNTWRKTFDTGQQLFDRRYYPGSLPMEPSYPKRTTLSGEFIDNGPLASNDFLG